LLEVKYINAFYGAVQVLHDVNLHVGAGEIVGLVGTNAAGKSSLMFTLAGLRTTYQGEVLLEGVAVDELPAYERPARGLVLVPERRRLFPFMTVLENLEIGAYAAAARAVARQTLDEVFALLPVLADRRKQVAGSMSGGEQQMLAIGRALMAKPRVLLLDEPTEGLAPIYVKLLFDLIIDLRAKGMTVMIVEQNVHHVLHTADRA
jgi:branched-chain amino acid transport system ATP-binding protein